MPEPVTLAMLAKAAPVLSVSLLGEKSGIGKQTLHSRLKRGRPELTAEESDALRRVLEGFGVTLTASLG